MQLVVACTIRRWATVPHSDIFLVSMKKFARAIRFQIMPPAILVVIIASLCFSVGEGLRLTPFPISAITRVEGPNVLLDAGLSHETSPHKYGPLDVPTQTQKRNKRQAIHFVCLPTGVDRELPTFLCCSSDDEPTHVVSVLFVSRPAGRAPPFVS